MPPIQRLIPLLFGFALLLAACSVAQPATPTRTPPPEAPAPTAAATPTMAAATPLQQGKTPEGYDYIGSPDAPVTLLEYSDFF
jgi:hypothetical protein